MSCTTLAVLSGQSKSTISRMLNYKKASENPNYRHSYETIMAVALTLQLNPEETQELFDTAFPEQMLWRKAVEKRWSVDYLDSQLSKLNLPTLTRV